MITIVRLRAQAWLGFMFSNLPNNLLTGGLKQTNNQPVSLQLSSITWLRSYLAASPTEGRPDINLEIFRNIDGILDWNVDCPEGKMIISGVPALQAISKTLFPMEDRTPLPSPLF